MVYKNEVVFMKISIGFSFLMFLLYYVHLPNYLQIQNIKYKAQKQYSLRRSLIEKYCIEHKSDPLLKLVNSNVKNMTNLCYDYKHNLIFCVIPKVASSTWESIFITLQGRYQNILNYDLRYF